MRQHWFILTTSVLFFVLGGFDAIHGLLGLSIGYLLEEPLGVSTETPKPIRSLRSTWCQLLNRK